MALNVESLRGSDWVVCLVLVTGDWATGRLAAGGFNAFACNGNEKHAYYNDVALV